MARKDKFTLPAIGKPKPKTKKTSASELGKVANKQFKQGSEDKNKKTVLSPFKTKETAKQSAERDISAKKNGKATDKALEEVDTKVYKNSKKDIESRKRRIARITGV